MGQYDIVRPLTEDEKKEITPLGSTTLLDKFLAELAKVASKFQKELRPFDSYGARIDFEDKVRTKMNEIAHAIDKSTVEKLDFGNLEEYGNVDLFEYLGKIEQQQTRLVAGIKQEVVIGQRYRFKAKKRGNKLSIFVPNERVEEFEKWLNKNFSETEKSDKPTVGEK